MARFGEDGQAAVAVKVDEPRRDDAIGGVDPAADVLGEWRVGGERPHPLALDDDRPRPWRPARAVHDAAARDQRSALSVVMRAPPGRQGGGRGPRPPGPCRGATGR